MSRILVIDDERSQRELLIAVLRQDAHECVTSGDGAEGLETARSLSPSLVLLDVRMPGLDGISVLRGIRETSASLPVVMMTAYGDVETAVEAMKLGAADFITKPIDINRLRALVGGLLGDERRASGAQERSDDEPASFVGTSPAARHVRELCRISARSSATVLITGESGTGKEVVTAAIHRLSPRADGPFVAINCAALPEHLLESELFGHEKGSFTDAVSRVIGKFEAAQGGTILLDEIAEMSVALQTRLLRVLQERTLQRVGGTAEIPVDVRVVAATNRDPAICLAEGTLREDLYYRLNVLNIPIPPLRDRPEDIPVLARHFLEKHGGGSPPRRLSEGTLALLASYGWPGNVRELENTVERALLFAKGTDILPEHLPPQLCGRVPETRAETGVRPGWSLQDVERDLIVKTLEVNGDNRTHTARALGMSRRALQMKIKKYGLE